MKTKLIIASLLIGGQLTGGALAIDGGTLARLTDKLSLPNGPLARRMAADALGKQGAAAEAAVPALLKALSGDAEFGVRMTAAWALGQIKTPASETVAGLIAALADNEWQVRHNATLALTWIGQPALPALKLAVAGENLAARAHATRALLVIEPALFNEQMPNLTAMMHHEHPSMRQYAAETVTQCGEIANAAVPELVALLDDKVAPVRKEAITALGRIGQPSVVAVPKIIEQLKTDTQRPNRAAAAITLSQIAKDNPAAIDALVSAFDDKDGKLRSYCANALGVMGRSAVPALEKTLQAEDPRTRELAAMALSIIGPPAQPAVGALIACLDDSDALVRTMVADALGKIGVSSDEVKGALEKARGKEAANTPLRAHYDQAMTALSAPPKAVQ